MTVPISTLAVLPFTGNDTVNLFALTFPTYQNTDVVGYVETIATGATVLLAEGVDYSLQNVNVPKVNGQMTLIDAGQAWISGGSNLDNGYRLLIKFSPDSYQTANLQNLGRFAAKEYGSIMDRFTMHTKALAAVLDRAMVFSDADIDAGFSALMPSAIGNADKILALNATENGFVYGPTVTSIFAAEAAAAASELAAAASETNAANSEAAALASEVAAAASAVAAAASEVAAAASAAAALASENNAEYTHQLTQFDSQVEVAFGDSPINIVAGDDSTLYLVDTTLGDVVFNMPAIASVPAGFKIATLKVVDQLNNILVNGNGAETLAGIPQRSSAQEGVGILITPNLALATDWDATFFASGYIVANALGGGGMTINPLQSIAAGGKITLTTDLQQLHKVEGNAAPRVADISPFVAPAFDGAIITLLGQSAVDTLEIKHMNAAGGCILNGDAILGLHDSLTLVYDQAAQRYYETSRRIY